MDYGKYQKERARLPGIKDETARQIAHSQLEIDYFQDTINHHHKNQRNLIASLNNELDFSAGSK